MTTGKFQQALPHTKRWLHDYKQFFAWTLHIFSDLDYGMNCDYMTTPKFTNMSFLLECWLHDYKQIFTRPLKFLSYVSLKDILTTRLQANFNKLFPIKKGDYMTTCNFLYGLSKFLRFRLFNELWLRDYTKICKHAFLPGKVTTWLQAIFHKTFQIFKVYLHN